MHKLARKHSILTGADRYRIYLLFGAVFLVMSLAAPRFLNAFNLTTIMKTAAMNGCVAIGFTMVMICGQLDLSIGTVVTLSGVIAIGLKPHLGYAGSVPLALAAGAALGLANGLLVTKAKINSFIVTLGTMTLLQGIIYLATGGNSVSINTEDAFAVSDVLGATLVPPITPRVLVTLVLVLGFEFFMQRTRIGKNFYMVGGNRATAWLAGINTDAHLVAVFVLSGLTAAVGGTLFAMESAAATLNLGDNSLMYIVAATIIGGTAMAGGRGGVLQTAVAILMLETLFNGLILLGFGNEVKIFVSGLILALVVLYEAYAVYRHEQTVGQRPELIRELEETRGDRP
jgi:ribose/xylose/arabinose/galactoside ABC-type transport system permease subunit